ncbi:DeoR family transcriptional regulator, glycerol-3-phosphate regulon repressor [Bosea sp. LC85]|nr:DeoR family transcriptional regulator, glycerol-3-phosphate regulon repressor [Bosea sp. LC85]
MKPLNSAPADLTLAERPPRRSAPGQEHGITVSTGLSHAVTLLFAVACGLSVANIYYAQPLLDVMARDLAISPAAIGGVVTVTQIGYALGLIFIVPLGDLLDRRRLIGAQALLSGLALLVVGLAPSAAFLLAGMVAVGLLAVVVQVLVAFAASMAADEERGRTVGTITSGIVIGILLARFVSGGLADIGGWRLVYLVSAVLTVLMACLLFRALPKHERIATRISYPELLVSVVGLFVKEPILRVRAMLAMLIFATFSVFWTSLVLPLSAAPFSLSHTEIGMFGLVGVAGALAAARAGSLADRGFGQYVTGLSLGLMVVSWIPIASMSASLWNLIIGIVLLDLAIQAVHITNQTMIFAVRPDARSRLVGGYMVFYSVGSALGSIASTMVYARAGWIGVCVLGASISLVALLFWAATRRHQPMQIRAD